MRYVFEDNPEAILSKLLRVAYTPEATISRTANSIVVELSDI